MTARGDFYDRTEWATKRRPHRLGLAIGLASGFLLKDAAKELYKRARAGWWHREYERTVTYDQNLPDQLERREPEPRAGQPRYGGTGAIGVPPERGI